MTAELTRKEQHGPRPADPKGPERKAKARLLLPLNEIERMSVADHPMPRILVASPNYAQGRLDCSGRKDCASDRQHAEESDQAQEGQAAEWKCKGQQQEPIHRRTSSPNYSWEQALGGAGAAQQPG